MDQSLTDWFNNPVPENGVLGAPVANAPSLYTEVTGDFVFRAKVRPNIAQPEVWLQSARVGDVFVCSYSLDGERFDMVRLFRLAVGATVKVGLEAQSPTGEGGLRNFSSITLEHRTLTNLRADI